MNDDYSTQKNNSYVNLSDEELSEKYKKLCFLKNLCESEMKKRKTRNKTVNKTANKTANNTVKKPVKNKVNKSTNKSVNKSANKQINKSTNKTTTNKSTNKSINKIKSSNRDIKKINATINDMKKVLNDNNIKFTSKIKRNDIEILIRKNGLVRKSEEEKLKRSIKN